MERMEVEEANVSGKSRKRAKHRLTSSQIGINLLDNVSHECLPGFNFSEDRGLENLRAYPLCSFSYPYPIYTSASLPSLIDPCHRRSREHCKYFSSLHRYHTFFNTYKKKKFYKAGMKKGIYPSVVVRFTEMLELNPDPYFCSRYDWYYTGGNLDLVEGRDVLLHVTGRNMDKLAISDILVDNENEILTPKLINEFGNFQEIFEVQNLTFRHPRPEITLSIRQKHVVSVYSYDEENFECTFKLKQYRVPFISSAHNPERRSAFITSNLEKDVYVWDVAHSTTEPVQNLLGKGNESVKKDQNWNCLRYFNQNTYAFADLQQFTLLDVRAPSRRISYDSGSFGKSWELCEKISGMCTSDYENLVYIGTSHKLFAVDMRYLGQELSNKYMVLRWVHQMNSSPLIIRAFHRPNYELIASTSSVSGDVRYFENTLDGESYTSPCIPYAPASLRDAYDSARIRGKCLNPLSHLKDRISCSITGMGFLQQNDKLYTLQSNSNGDVFSQKIQFGTFKEPSEQDNARKMDDWERDSIEVTKNLEVKLNVTEVADLGGVSKALRCERLDTVDELVLDEPKRPRPRMRWQKSFQGLQKYKDALVTDLLSIWDIEKDEKNMIDITLKQEESNDKIKIEEWINQAVSIANSPPMVSIGSDAFFSSTQIMEDLPELFEPSEMLSASQSQRLVHANPKNKPKRYVQGF